jgi:thiosulfate oxidation carrier complex protein SoxZ
MDDRRRFILQVFSVGFANGVLGFGRPAAAAPDPFEARTLSSVIESLGFAGAVASPDIHLDTSDFADNAAAVPVRVESRIPGTQRIDLIVERNPFPYIAGVDLSGGAHPFVSVVLRIAETSAVRAVVAAQGKHFFAQKQVRVTAGGCGGDDAELPRQAYVPAPIRVRAVHSEGGADVRVLVAHPMENGLRKTSGGQPIPPHFLRTFVARLNDRVVFSAALGRSVATNPRLEFKLRSAAVGDRLVLSWEDSRGLNRTDETSVIAA